jgi:hypothetical protein
MAGKTLYEILGVPESATVETINAACASSLSALDAEGDKAAAGAGRLALKEAIRILSSEQLRRGYDGRLALARAPAPAVIHVEEKSWLAKYSPGLLVIVTLAAVPGYFLNERRIERLAAERVAEIRRAEEKKKLEELEARRADALLREDERQKRLEEARRYALEQQERARASYSTMMVDRRIQQENQNAQQEQDRQRRLEEMQRSREENEARMRLEKDKRLLRQYQCANGPC